MKKFASLVLALAMIFSLSISASAESAENISNNQATGSTSQNVNINTTSTSAGKVYFVTVEWDSLTFAYNYGTQGAWDPTTHRYGGYTGEGWTRETLNVGVYNHSNDTIYYKAEVAKTEDLDITATPVGDGNFNDGIQLASADTGDSLGNPTKAPSSKFTLTASTPSMGTTPSSGKIGTLTVSIKNGPFSNPG